MSCFIMNADTIGYISNFIADYIIGGYNTTGLYVSVPDEFIREVTKTTDVWKNVYLKLYSLNYMAFEVRYEGRHGENLADCLEFMRDYEQHNKRIHNRDDREVQPYHYQLLKSIQCYLYQCAESEKLMNSTTFKAVKKFEDALTSFIINALPEYQAAEWK